MLNRSQRILPRREGYRVGGPNSCGGQVEWNVPRLLVWRTSGFTGEAHEVRSQVAEGCNASAAVQPQPRSDRVLSYVELDGTAKVGSKKPFDSLLYG